MLADKEKEKEDDRLRTGFSGAAGRHAVDKSGLGSKYVVAKVGDPSFREVLREQVSHHGFAFLAFPQDAKRVISETIATGQSVLKKSAREELDGLVIKGFSDTGYMRRPRVKEQFQIRLGEAMPYGGCGKELRPLVEQAFPMLDGIARQCLSTLVGEGRAVEHLSMLDPADIATTKHAGKDQYMSASVFTFTRYFNEEPDDVDPCKAHADAGFLTLCIDVEPGLQLFDPCGAQWIEVQTEGIESDAIVIIGSALASNGKYFSTSHKVVQTKGQRFSTVFKLRPRPDVFGPRTEADYKLYELQEQLLNELRSLYEETANQFPDENLIEIFKYLDSGIDLIHCMLVCKAWSNVAADNSLWKNLLEHNYGSPTEEEIATAKETSWMSVYGDRANRGLKWRKIFIADNCGSSLLSADFPEKLRAYSEKNGLKTQTQSPYENCKIVLIGANAVGKTCLALTIASNAFPEEYIPTVFDEWVGVMALPGVSQHVQFSFWDTCASPDYARLRVLAYPGTSVFLCMFAVDNRDSFEDIPQIFKPEIRNHSNSAIIVVATKSDLRETKADCITYEEGAGMAKHVGAVAYLETTAKQMSSSVGGLQELITYILSVGLASDAGLFLKGQKFEQPQEGKNKKQKRKGKKEEKQTDSRCISQ